MEVKLINQGAYGCIFYPGVSCSGDTENKLYVTKIEPKTDTVENEYDIGKIIRSIRGYQRYYAPIVKSCPAKLQQEYSSELAKCNVYNKTAESNKFVSNKIRYVGKRDIETYITSRSQKRVMREIIRTYAYIVRAVETLLAKNVIHYDIRYNNIMFDSSLNVPILIDFGLSFQTEALADTANMRNVFYTSKMYPYWPIDVHICNYIANVANMDDFATERDATNIINSFMASESGNPNSIFSVHFAQDKQREFPTKFKAFFSKYIRMPWKSIYDEMTRAEIYSTWDLYATAVVYLNAIDTIYMDNHAIYDYLAKEYAPEFTKYMELITNIVYSMPDQRPDIKTTKKTLEILRRTV